MTRLDYLKQQIEYLREHPTDECVEWPFALDRVGYGKIRIGGRQIGTHRLAYVLYYGVVPSKLICHHCDDPACYNPLHLYEGTIAQNADDRRKRGRSKFTAAMRQHQAISRSCRPLKAAKAKERTLDMLANGS